MVRLIQSNKGFTLLEIMFVVVVLSVILSIALIQVKPTWDWLQKKMFISQIQSDLYYAHSYAINRKETVVIRISEAKNEYEARASSSNHLLFHRSIPRPIHITQSNLNHFHLTPQGTISNFGTVQFTSNGQSFKLTFHIGRGRFIVQQ